MTIPRTQHLASKLKIDNFSKKIKKKKEKILEGFKLSITSSSAAQTECQKVQWNYLETSARFENVGDQILQGKMHIGLFIIILFLLLLLLLQSQILLLIIRRKRGKNITDNIVPTANRGVLLGNEKTSISSKEVLKYDGDSWSSRYRNTGNSPKDFMDETGVPEILGELTAPPDRVYY